MPYTPVELRHVRIGRSLWGYRPDVVERLLDEVADSFEAVWRDRGELEDKVHELEKEFAELKLREDLFAQTLISAEQAAVETRANAKREAELIVAEAHQEARSIVRGVQGEHARLAAEARRIETLLRAALGVVEEGEPVAVPETEAGTAQARLETWPRRDDTREFPRPVHPVPGLPSEPEAQAG
jgi:cell division initiation protein